MLGSIGMPELIIIFVIALIIFGPRKLPELGRSLGKSINEFKRASNELRNTLDEEIRVEETPLRRTAARHRARRVPYRRHDEHERAPPVRRAPRPRSWRSCPSPAQLRPTTTIRTSNSPTPTSRGRRGEDVVPGASRRAPETPDQLRPRARRRLRHRLHLHQSHLRASSCCRCSRCCRPGGTLDVHARARSLHAVHEDRRARRPVHRAAAHPLAGVAVHRARASTRTKRSSRFRSCCSRRSSSSSARSFSHYVAFPWTWKFFISFETPYMGSCRRSTRRSRCTSRCCSASG